MIVVNITEKVMITVIIVDMGIYSLVSIMKGGKEDMTEKRFTLKGLVEGVPNICDNGEIIEQEEVVTLLNELHKENQEMKQKGLMVLEFYINKLKNTNNDIQSVRDEIWIVKDVLYEMGVLNE